MNKVQGTDPSSSLFDSYTKRKLTATTKFLRSIQHNPTPYIQFIIIIIIIVFLSYFVCEMKSLRCVVLRCFFYRIELIVW